MAGSGIERRSKCNMDISALRALVALREHASFARVSEQMNLSSSAVFCQIRQLEDQLRLKLYERHGKALDLTVIGNSLAKFAEEIVHMHDFALNALKPNGTSSRELVRLGCGPNGSVEIVPYFMQALVKRSPGTEIRMISADDNSMLHDLHSGLIDVLLMSLPAETSGTRTNALVDERTSRGLTAKELRPVHESKNLRSAYSTVHRLYSADSHECRIPAALQRPWVRANHCDGKRRAKRY